MEKQLSIIIPTYNMEAYIGKCLDSLLIPEFDQVEVLVVNDGSKDRSSEIAHSYAERYPDSIRVIDKPNGNYGSCINAALPQCTGRYVKILDADDMFDTKEFSKFISLLPAVDVDVIFTRCNVVDEKGATLEVTGFTKERVNIDSIYVDVQDVLSNSILMHWITYNQKIFTKFDYHQPEGISYTDNIWSFVPIVFCRTGLFSNSILYKYLVGRSGQTVGTEQMKSSIHHFAIIANTMVDYYLKFSIDKQLKPIITKNCLCIVTYVYNLIMRFHSVDTLKMLQTIDEDLAKRAPEIYKLIGDYSIYKSINYKIYNHLRESGYSPSFAIPPSVRLRFKNTLRYEAFKKRLKNLIERMWIMK